MLIEYLKYTALFFIAIFLQLIVFDNIYLYGYANIFFYIIFIVLLPIGINRYTLMIIGFSSGMLIDIFNNTPGMHAIATVAISFLRPFILRVYAPRDGYESEYAPRISNYGYFWFVKYTISLLFVHHLIFYYIEIFRFDIFFLTFFKVIVSSILGLIVILISQLLFVRNKQKL